MPTCQECGGYFPREGIIQGRRRHLSKRKRCFKCSPFGAHSTRRIGAPVIKKGDKLRCSICGRSYIYDKRKGHSTFRCRNCSADIRRVAVKKRLVALLGGKCSRCGYSKCIAALHAHHKNPKTKKFGLGDAHCRAWKNIVREAKKCILVCANCHAEIHHKKSVYEMVP